MAAEERRKYILSMLEQYGSVGKIKYFIKKLLVVFLLLKQKSKRKYNQKYNQPFVNCNKTKMMY